MSHIRWAVFLHRPIKEIPDLVARATNGHSHLKSFHPSGAHKPFVLSNESSLRNSSKRIDIIDISGDISGAKAITIYRDISIQIDPATYFP